PEYVTDPELIHERFGREAEIIVDGGPGGTEPTTVVDLTQGEAEIVRQGRGVLD
ncbi:MAG: Sua5/YciO/YrdC/YwlC family protein, partial [Alistipes sp.]|nr:Sua5/YciO/YrdC/YwlC family protein [Alistipes sp.]